VENKEGMDCSRLEQVEGQHEMQGVS
jgi:hypothetical protein